MEKTTATMTMLLALTQKEILHVLVIQVIEAMELIVKVRK